MKKTIIYIDGFNLYYRIKQTPYKWLNLQKLSQSYLDLKKHQIVKIKYFTAKVKRKKFDSSNVIRQNIYLRALKSLSSMEIIFGQFKERQIRGILCDLEDRELLKKDTVRVSKWEEKESDVNIASHIISDAYESEYDCTVLMSNDTDLKTPLKYVKRRLKKQVGIISPRRNIHIELIKICDFRKAITNKVLDQCQFPEKMKDAKGEFFCPPKWKQIKDQKI